MGPGFRREAEFWGRKDPKIVLKRPASSLRQARQDIFGRNPKVCGSGGAEKVVRGRSFSSRNRRDLVEHRLRGEVQEHRRDSAARVGTRRGRVVGPRPGVLRRNRNRLHCAPRAPSAARPRCKSAKRRGDRPIRDNRRGQTPAAAFRNSSALAADNRDAPCGYLRIEKPPRPPNRSPTQEVSRHPPTGVRCWQRFRHTRPVK